MGRKVVSDTTALSAMGKPFLAVGACFIVVEAILLRAADGGYLDGVRVAIASAASAGLAVLGHRVALSGFSVATNAGLVTVAAGCLPIVHLSLIAALFGFGVSIPLLRRVLLMGALTVVVLALEVARIMTVAALFEAGSADLEYVHLTVMPAVTLGVVVGSWLYQLRASNRD